MPTPWAETRAAFADAATWFTRTAAQARGHWDLPALGEWCVRELVGHTSRALLTVETYLAQPAGSVDVGSPADYFRLVLADADHAAVAERGRIAGAALGGDPAAQVAVIAERVLTAVAAADEDALLTTPVGGMRLTDYLPTRTFELTVHTCDLAAALGEATEVPPAAALASLSLVGQLAAGTDRAAPLLRAATGRVALPASFTVL